MLDFLRKSATSFFAWLILGVLALVFGLSFGLPSDSLTLGAKPLVHVHGEAIDDVDYREQFSLIQVAYAIPKDARFAQLMGLKEEVLETAVEREILAHTAEELGLAATKTDVEDLILAGHVIVLGETRDWLGDLQFNYDLFKKSFLRNLQTTEQAYLETQRRELLARTLRDLVASSTAVSEQELRQAYEAQANKLSLRFAQFDPSEFGTLVDPTSEQIESYVSEHRDELLTTLAASGARFTKLPRQARVFFIEIPKDQEGAANLAKKARASVTGGKDFRAVAREVSKHETAPRGGDYGWVSLASPTGLDPAIDTALETLEPGATSEVIEGEAAFYIVRNGGVREGDVPEAEALAELAEEAVRVARGKELAKRAAEEALAAVKSGRSLEEVFSTPGGNETSDAVRPTLRETGLFSRTEPIPTLGESPELVEAAWASDPNTKLLDQVYEVGQSYVLAGLVEKEAASDEGFQEARDELYDALVGSKAALVTARWTHRQCLEAKAQGDVTANDDRIARVVAYEDAPADLALKPYSVCDRVGNRGGLLRAGIAGGGVP